ncbi:MAG: rcc01693 family protein, partial [Beijerinckiaceae bacterium]
RGAARGQLRRRELLPPSAAAGGALNPERSRTASPIPWVEAMRFGFGRLRLSSSAFWGLTPIELAAAAGGFAPHRAEPMGQADLLALLQRFPD